MSQALVTKRDRTFQSIQYLRAGAALMVVAYHVKVRIGPMGYRGGWPEWLGAGVDIFFVISGFIMWMTTCDRPIGPLEFLKRRLLRIAPLYWLITCVAVVVSIIAPSLVDSGRFDAVHMIASVLFLPNLNPTTQTFEPVLPQGWTLNYEMEFYALFALCLLAPVAIRQWLMPMSLIVIVSLGSALSHGTALAFWCSTLILEFGFGVVIAILLARGFCFSLAMSSWLVGIGAAGLIASSPLVGHGLPRFCLSGVCAALIVAGAVFREERRPVAVYRFPRLLGDGSYSIYLTHGLALSLLAFVWTRLAGTSTTAIVLFVPLAIIGAACVGLFVHFLFERPLLRIGGIVSGSRRPLAIEEAEDLPFAGAFANRQSET